MVGLVNRICRHTYVCFDCMESRRAPPREIKVVCPKCNNSMIELSYKIRIPKKNKKSWDKFKEWYYGG